MRKFTSFLLTAILLVSFLAVNALAADKYYTGTVTHAESFTQVFYKWVMPANADSAGSSHSPAFFIADCNDADQYCEAISAGTTTADFNIIYHFSMDGISWTAVTPGTLDQCSSTLKQDTLGIEDGTQELNFHLARWLIIEALGIAPTDQTDYVTFRMTLTKDLDLQHNGQPVWVGAVKNKRTGSWVNP